MKSGRLAFAALTGTSGNMSVTSKENCFLLENMPVTLGFISVKKLFSSVII